MLDIDHGLKLGTGMLSHTSDKSKLQMLRRRLYLTPSLRIHIRRVTTSSKPRVVVLGAGWGGFRVARDLDKTKFDVTVVSPRYCSRLCLSM